jgi:NADH dehydrogenase
MGLTKINLPETGRRRVVIIGAGFAGLRLARELARSEYQVVLIDRNNFHQFQPLFYQVAMAGLEPSSIVFPLRKLFQRRRNVFIRVTEVSAVDMSARRLHTPLGIVNYDYLVLAIGADTNYFGNERLRRLTLPMKSVSEALYIRNKILLDLEKALTEVDNEERQALIDIVIVGGGATGVEVAGALAEMRKYVLPKDYPELNAAEMDIHLVEGGAALLPGMSAAASSKAKRFLEDLGVKVHLNRLVVDYDGWRVRFNDGERMPTRKVIWAAGIRGSAIGGIPEEAFGPAGRILVNRHSQVAGFEDIYAIGDIAYMAEEKYPRGHPQVAQVALQQARHLAVNLRRLAQGRPMRLFFYRDKGSMATIGRNKAVVDLPWLRFQGALAWFAWLFVHLFQLLGVKNRLFVFLNWVWNYFTYDQSLRLIIKPRAPGEEALAEEKLADSQPGGARF